MYCELELLYQGGSCWICHNWFPFLWFVVKCHLLQHWIETLWRLFHYVSIWLDSFWSCNEFNVIEATKISLSLFFEDSSTSSPFGFSFLLEWWFFNKYSLFWEWIFDKSWRDYVCTVVTFWYRYLKNPFISKKW